MSPGLYKLLKSYFVDVLVESSSSIYNPNLELYLVNGRFQLCANDAIYSFDDKYLNFREAFKQTNWSNLDIDHVLVLGLGLASIPYILEKKHQLNFDYTAIEIDEAIIYLASKYRIPILKSNIQVIHADANIYMEQSQEEYDMICMDVFIEQTIPEAFVKQSSIEKLHNMLKPNGLLFYNILHKGHEETSEFLIDQISNIFKHSQAIPVENNIIVRATK